MYKYTFIDKNRVVEAMAKGLTLLIADFKSLKVLLADDLTMSQINYLVSSPDTVVYARSEA